MDPKTVTIYTLLSSPLASSLLSTHPNDLTSAAFQIPSEWTSWWNWASQIHTEPRWLLLLRYYNRPLSSNVSSMAHDSDSEIPGELAALIDTIRSLQVDRDPSLISASLDPNSPAQRAFGMSPKKYHEVTNMTAYIAHILNRRELHSLRYAVDVGSGQGYLSRALKNMGLHVLALDSNQIQTSGAERWKTKVDNRNKKQKLEAEPTPVSVGVSTEDLDLQTSHLLASSPCQSNSFTSFSNHGSVSHRTVHITPQSLETSIHHWLLSDPPNIDAGTSAVPHPVEAITAVPVLLVALHACGSLTPDILRTFLSNRRIPVDDTLHSWKSRALVVVGCCYNLMSCKDFPLSTALRRSLSHTSSSALPLACLHLASQVPSQWTRTTSSLDAAKLSIRKVVYRALLQPILQACFAKRDLDITVQQKLAGTGETPENRRLGKLNDAAYQSWATFLTQAGIKMGVRFEEDGLLDVKMADRRQMESRLEVLHVLRCLLGPLIESLILLDRCDWLREELQSTNHMAVNGQRVGGREEMNVELLSLFDQATGSGRNVAIVISPKQ